MRNFRNLVSLTFTVLFFALYASPVNAESEKSKRAPNHLLGVQSPYLQQHIYNVVDWYPWGKEALEKAKKENKPIFLSIGYSTCHWCHVMARESFDNEEIGQYLNKHFIAIKVDRERRPDLDNQFMLVTEALTGTGGWPNSLFLTSGAKPFYAFVYLPPANFLEALKQIKDLWHGKRPSLEEEGKRISLAIKGYLNRTEAARSLTADAIAQAVQPIIKIADEFNGGLGVSPKFPQESALLLLLAQAERGDDASLKVVVEALDGMIKGGIHDHVGGGFHRYSTDERWLVPHFEKMLYNQAMIGELLVRAYELTGTQRYKFAATRLFDYVLRDLQDKQGGFYSAEDAESKNSKGKKGEGFYYIWSKQEFDELAKEKQSVLSKVYSLTDAGNFEGENILHFEVLPEEIAKKSGMGEADFYQQLTTDLERLRQERLKRHVPHKDKKVIVSWNAMMIGALARASHVFERPDYYQAALGAMNFITQNMLSSDGLKRVSYEGKVGVPGQLADYAGLGVALLSLHDFSPAKTVSEKMDYLKIATRLAGDVQQRFGKPWAKTLQPFRMTEVEDGLGAFPPLDDNPIPSGNALALNLFDGIAKRVGDMDYKKKSVLLTAAVSGHALSNPRARGMLINSAYGVNVGGVGYVRNVANGNVKVSLKLDRSTKEVMIDVKVKSGWHINSNKPLEDYLIATNLKIDGVELGSGLYPEAEEKSLSFNSKKLSLYEGDIRLVGKFTDKEGVFAHDVGLALQACSDKICLPPENLKFRFWSR